MRVDTLILFQFRGATCYLNSLFQALYMNPGFRSAIFRLPLCDGSLDKLTEFVKGGKRKMLLEIQRLCVFLQEVNKKAWSTKDLTHSFGWHGGEAQQ